MVSISGVTVETSAEFSAPPETSYGAEQNLSGLSILFGVPRGYFQARGRSADPKSTLTSRDLERIKSDTGNEVLALVQNLLTNQRKQLAPDAVRVVTYEQLASKADSVKTVPQVGLRGWMRQHARWIVLGIASLVAVLLLRDMSRELARTRRGMSKSRMSSEEPRERSESEHVVTDPGVVLPMAETRGEESEDGEQTHDNYIHETLTDVVREDPQAAAAMLRNWVEKAG